MQGSRDYRARGEKTKRRSMTREEVEKRLGKKKHEKPSIHPSRVEKPKAAQSHPARLYFHKSLSRPRRGRVLPTGWLIDKRPFVLLFPTSASSSSSLES